MANQYNNIAVIVAAGNGARFGNAIPKQYTKIADESILRRVIAKFINHELIDSVIVVIGKGHEEIYQQEVAGLKLLPYVTGGIRRQDSVRNALEVISQYSPKNVLIHDAVRVLVDASVITEIVKALDTYEGAIAATKLVDTLKYVEGQTIMRTVDRNNLFLAQTPQGFRYEVIHTLHRLHQDLNFTDDAGLLECAGKQVKIIESLSQNFKITTPEDLRLAQQILREEYVVH